MPVTLKKLSAEIGVGYLAQILEAKGFVARDEYPDDCPELAAIRRVRTQMKVMNSRSVRRALDELERCSSATNVNGNGNSKPKTESDFRSQIQKSQNQTSQIQKSDQLDLLKKKAQQKAAGLTTAENLLTAHYYSTKEFEDPDLAKQVLASETFLENVINGSTPEYELNNMVQSAIETILFGEQQSLEPAPAETFFSQESSGFAAASNQLGHQESAN